MLDACIRQRAEVVASTTLDARGMNGISQEATKFLKHSTGRMDKIISRLVLVLY